MTCPACSWSDGEFPHKTRWVPGGTHVESDGRRGKPTWLREKRVCEWPPGSKRILVKFVFFKVIPRVLFLFFGCTGS